MQLWPDKSELQHDTLIEIRDLLREIRDALKPQKRPTTRRKANEHTELDA